jgi:ferric-dicitrate binding protein FerR (iron transport regulator)
MNTPNTPRPEMDDLLNDIRNEPVEPAVIERAASRVWARVSQEAAPATHVIRGCADFQAMLPAWHSGSLAESRRVLLEDHLHECVACRHAAEAGNVLQFPRLGQAPVRKATIWQLPLQVPMVRYAMAAAMFLVLGIGSWGVLRSILSLGPRFTGSKATVQVAEGQLFRLAGAGLVPVKVGEEIPAGAEVRTGRDSHAVIRLKDGSRVEMRERTAFSVTESPKDLNVQLARGAVIVQAAKRSSGHLYVTTRDVKVAVTGTVFSVDAGIKGSRVCVIEGEVHVDQDSTDTVLHPGDQKTSDGSVEPVAISSVISWSANAPQHLALLHEMIAARSELAKIEQPGMRYSSKMLGRVPGGTVFYLAIPNIGQQLGQAQEVMFKRMQESPVLQQWWAQQSNAAAFTKTLDSIRNFSAYLGDEVVVAAAVSPGPNGKAKFYAPVLMAELKQGGFKDFAMNEFRRLANGGDPHVTVVDDPSSAKGDASDNVLMSVSNDMVAITPQAEALRLMAPALQAASQPQSGTLASPFLQRVQQSYQEGVGFLMAADLGSMAAGIASQGPDAQHGIAPLGNVQYMMVEQRDGGSATETRATMTFSGPRQGMFGWLAKPGPMAALDYVTAQASLAAGFVITSPGQVIDDMLSWAAANNANFTTDLSTMETELGFSIRNDLAASLGSEFVLSLDGPVLPVPSWKIVTEVYDPGKLQWVFSKMVDDANAQAAKNGKQPLQTSQQAVGNLTYYQIVSPASTGGAEIDYVFDGGYLIAAPSRALLEAAIAAKTNGTSLSRSAAFRSALPRDGQNNFSALAYENLGSLGASVSQALQTFANHGTDPAVRQKMQAAASAAPSQASLVGAYGESDRIILSSTALPGFGSGTLMSMTGPLSMFNLFEQAQSGNKGTKGP